MNRYFILPIIILGIFLSCTAQNKEKEEIKSQFHFITEVTNQLKNENAWYQKILYWTENTEDDLFDLKDLDTTMVSPKDAFYFREHKLMIYRYTHPASEITCLIYVPSGDYIILDNDDRLTNGTDNIVDGSDLEVFMKKHNINFHKMQFPILEKIIYTSYNLRKFKIGKNDHRPLEEVVEFYKKYSTDARNIKQIKTIEKNIYKEFPIGNYRYRYINGEGYLILLTINIHNSNDFKFKVYNTSHMLKLEYETLYKNYAK